MEIKNKESLIIKDAEQFESDFFVARSQAKRLLSGFERFENIELDFTGIKEIGQGFADEIFRVFKNNHPNSNIVAINCTKPVENMIKHVQSTYNMRGG